MGVLPSRWQFACNLIKAWRACNAVASVFGAPALFPLAANGLALTDRTTVV
jgi:hypothetical protein